MLTYTGERNLARSPQTQVTASIVDPTGGGARDPSVLLNEIAHRLDDKSLPEFFAYRTYDTYDGQNQADTPDWYTLEFAEMITANCIEMTMGIPYRDGGWWTSLNVEFYNLETAQWQSVKNLLISPAYDFEDQRKHRLPYETYALVFEEVTTRRLRLIGMPGGIAHFTSLARLAVYYRDLVRWDPTCLPTPPVPHLFRLIPPALIFDLSESLSKLTGLTLDIPYVEYYLDDLRFEKQWQMWIRNYQGEPKLWFLIADAIGWHTWAQQSQPDLETLQKVLTGSTVHTFFQDMMASAVAPIVIDNQEVETISTEAVLLKDHFDLAWHQRYAEAHGFPWSIYQAALERTPQLTMKQLEGAAELLNMITNTIIVATARNDHAYYENLRKERPALLQRKDMIREAIAYMQTNVENAIDVSAVAHHLGISSSHFCTLFAEQIGCSPGDYLITLRLERAKRYLAHSHMSITNVCTKLGYTPSHFSRLFKRHIGCTPREFVQQKQKLQVIPLRRPGP